MHVYILECLIWKLVVVVVVMKVCICTRSVVASMCVPTVCVASCKGKDHNLPSLELDRN